MEIFRVNCILPFRVELLFLQNHFNLYIVYKYLYFFIYYSILISIQIRSFVKSNYFFFISIFQWITHYSISSAYKIGHQQVAKECLMILRLHFLLRPLECLIILRLNFLLQHFVLMSSGRDLSFLFQFH